MKQRIIGLDLGSRESGMVVLDNSTDIVAAFNLKYDQLYPKITNYLYKYPTIVVIEDLAPYLGRLSPSVIETAKLIGEAVYRLKIESGLSVEFIQRSKVKKWAFDAFPEICVPLIDKKIKKKGQIIASTGEARKAHAFYVDDKVLTECMKHLYKIPAPAPGSGYQHNLKDHNWQALAAASAFIGSLKASV